MLQKLNERIRGVVAWFIVGLISLMFVLFGVEYYFQSRQGSAGPVVTVNAEPIASVELETALRRSRQQAPGEQEQVLKKQLLDTLIFNTVLAQAASQAGLVVPVAQAMQTIAALPQFQEAGHFSFARYQQALANALYTPASFLREVQRGMLINQQRFGVIGSEFILPAELTQYARFLLEKRAYEYTILPLSLLKDQIVITPESLAQEYKQHAKQMKQPMQVQVSYVLLEMEPFKKQIELSEATLKQDYQDNLKAFTTPAKWQIQHILFAFPQGASAEQTRHIQQQAEQAYAFLKQHPEAFTQWVKTKSDDVLSTKQNGILPWIEAGQSVLDPVLKTLTRSGELAKPYQTAQGYELIKLVAYEPSTVKPFNMVKPQIREQLLTERAQALYLKAVEALGEQSYQDPDTLESVARALHLPILHSQLFSKQEGHDPFTSLPQVRNAAFSQDVLDNGNNSEVIQLDDMHVAVLRVEKKHPERLLSFEEAKPMILKRLVWLKSKALIQQAATQLMQGQVVKLFATLPWHEEKNVSRDEETTQPILKTLAFQIPAVGQLKGQFLSDQAYGMVRLKRIMPGTLDAFDEEQKHAFIQQLASTLGTVEYDLYAQAFMKQASISPHIPQ